MKMGNINTKKSYNLEDICPYPFDKSLNMIPFSQNFEMTRFDKYKGRMIQENTYGNFA